ncbi:MAG: transcription antitermination factor NusB [Gammaproteobacteria bacterium]|nr:transcription antitermination factor NusB [Gammaproteobacteria bacterium]MXW73633.1 transcription antitermination factor NusB [Chromatiales bacterium]MYA31238.1 transcription antitermination factor NusB [Gammaproteobacteria bacterium]MYF66982.1 transcription antitermination factor NusB [Gammaproteobacteria bacterium]MYK36414.1 transcription antitermination factor NusB [Gammaproteobacteria bacterium]
MRWERRRRARRLLVQALYQQQLTGSDANEILAQFRLCEDYGRADTKFFTELLRAATTRRDELDRQISAASDIPIERIDPVERAVLWTALAEMQGRGTRRAVAINEAIELAREFGADQGYRFVNAVLDRWARATPEVRADPEADHAD